METLGARSRSLLLLLLLGSFARTAVLAQGWLFLVKTRNAPAVEDGQTAQDLCERRGARLASAEELKEAVGRCSFPSCTRGWLAGPAVGTIVCDDMARGQQAKAAAAAYVKVEDVTAVTRQMDIFCFKDKGVAVCGDPPSFPHVLLRRQTGSEMGDELTYGCAPGYALPGGRSTFDLLCNSCGEWYGQVQLCAKGETDVQVDYGDKFPGEGHVSYDDSDGPGETRPSETEGDEPEPGPGEGRRGRPGARTPRPEEQQRVQVEDEDAQPQSMSTESSVSLLSQKHLFWFPSETFREPQRPEVTGVSGVVGVTVAPAWEEDNHIGVRPSGSMEDIKASDAAKTGARNRSREGLRERGTGTEESWLDGYPVTEDAREDEEKEEDNEGRPGAGSTVEEEEEHGGGLEDRRRTDGPEHVETGRAQRSSSAPSLGFTRVTTASPTRPVRYSAKHIPAGPAPASTADGGDVDLQPSTRHPLLIGLGATASTADGRASAVPWPTTGSPYPLLDHMPGPTKREEVTRPYQEAPLGGATTGSSHRFPGTHLYEESIERDLTQQDSESKAPPTQEACISEGCPSLGRGPVAVIVGVALCALLAAAALATWCYKKRQQKSSVYKMNGQGQGGAGSQHIEMQQKV